MHITAKHINVKTSWDLIQLQEFLVMDFTAEAKLSDTLMKRRDMINLLYFCSYVQPIIRTHARTHARKQARTHTRTHTHTHTHTLTHTHARAEKWKCSQYMLLVLFCASDSKENIFLFWIFHQNLITRSASKMSFLFSWCHQGHFNLTSSILLFHI